MITFKKIIFQYNIMEKKCSCSRCLWMEIITNVIWWSKCSLVVTSKYLGSCLIMWNVSKIEEPLPTMCMFQSIVKWWWLPFVTCNLKANMLNVSYGKSWTRWCQKMVFLIQTSKLSWSQANWNAMQIMYSNGDQSELMVNRERTCYFH